MTDASAGLPAAVSNNRSKVFFCIANFFWWMSLYLYVPFLPVYIQSAGVGLDMVGTILSAYAIPQILFRIPIGVLSDRLGRRKPLAVAGIIVSSLAALGLGLSSNSAMLFLSRMTAGIGVATWVVFPLYFSAYYLAQDSGKAIGFINFVRNTALIAASAAGGFIAEEYGLEAPFFVAAGLGVAGLLALFGSREKPIRQPNAPSMRSSVAIITRPFLLLVSVMAILFNFVLFTGVFGFIPIYAAGINASSGELGLITMINLGFAAVGALVSNRLRAWLGYRSSIILGAVLISASLFLIPYINAVPVLMLVQVSCGLGSGLLSSFFLVLSVHGLPRETQATAMGTFQAVYAIGMLAGPLISGIIGNSLSLDSVFYLAASIALLIVALAFLPAFSRRVIG